VRFRGGRADRSNFAAVLQQALVRHRVIGVPLAADFTRFSEAEKQSPTEIRKRLGLDVNRPTGLLAGCNVGRNVFVEAMARVFEKVPDCEAVLSADVQA
jgi:hypothetical protein